MSAEGEQWVLALCSEGSGGHAAQQVLRAKLVKGLRQALASRGVGDDVCEDFAQEALVRIRERLPTFRGDSRFMTWALSIALRLAFDELRHSRWKDVSFEEITSDSGSLTFEPCAEATQEKVLLRERVLAALREVIEQRITEKQRAVLLAEFQGMPDAEIAASLGMTRNALYKLSHDARKRVKAHLEASGFSPEDALGGFE
jgi:RNA polymerase sigma-70 factor (ECF subfamily)